jgi:very-short-patch-repair endonuclease
MPNINRSVGRVKWSWTEEARSQRQHATPAESALWSALRNRRLAGLKFRRNQTLHGLYADFFCAEHNLVIELDGGVHLDQVEYDAARTVVLGHLSLRVIRFQNEEVLERLPDVLARIRSATSQ